MVHNKMELDEKIYAEITRLCAVGDDLAKQKKHTEALAEYNEAWRLIPEPKSEWEASTWILAAIADMHFLLGDIASAREDLELAMTCPGAVGNPFLHLRLGQVRYEQKEYDASADELMRAYMGAGKDIFAGEDTKYLAFLKTRAIID